MKTFLIILAGIGIFAGIIGLSIVFFPVNTLQKEIGIAYDAQDKVLNADNAIYNYEWFKQKYEDIQANKRQLINAQDSYGVFISELPKDRVNWGFEDKQEVARLNSVVLGLKNLLESQIADYDARAKMATRNIFENSVLPSYIDALTFIKK